MKQNVRARFLLLFEQSNSGYAFLFDLLSRLQWLDRELSHRGIELIPQPFLFASQPHERWDDWIESQYGRAQINLWRNHPSTFWQYASSSLQSNDINGIITLTRHHPAELAAEARGLLQSVDASRVLYLSLDQTITASQTDGSTLMPFDDLEGIIRQLAARLPGAGSTNPVDPSRRVAASREDDSGQGEAPRYRSWPPSGDEVESAAAEPLPTAASPPVAVEPSEQLTEVRLGVSTPSELGPGDQFVARFAAYTPAFKEEVERVFKQEAPSSPPRLDLESSKWKKDARVTVGLRAEHVQIENPVQTFSWNGEKNILRFDAKVLPDASGKVLILKFDIAVEGLSLLSLRPEIQLSAASGSVSPTSVLTETRAPRTAFASYAHADKVEVFNRISSVASFTGVDFFTDDVSIMPGEQWKARLESEINKRDVFLLFWSRHARESTYVDWEWRTALAAKRNILPQALEPAEVAPPPEELSDLQFGGVYERLIASLRKP